MAAQGGGGPPPPPDPHTFAAGAMMGYAATRQRPALVPLDDVLQVCPRLCHREALALRPNLGQQPIPCAESVLRLAMTLVHNKADDPDFTVVPLHAAVPFGGMTILQMQRRLRRMVKYKVDTFPIYAIRDVAGELEYVLVYGKHRKDNYAMVFVEAGIDHGEPLQNHWTFMLVDEVPVLNPNPEPVRPVMIYTRMPVYTSERCYWRCRPTAENARMFHAAEELGHACSCCQQIICWHEFKWRLKWWWRSRQNPVDTPVRITMRQNHVMNGCYRATFLRAVRVPGWKVTAAPQNGISVVCPDGKRSYMPGIRNNEAVVNMGYMLGFLPSKMLAGFDTFYWRIKLGWRHAVERMTCSFKQYEHPTDRIEMDVPPYRLLLAKYERQPVGVRVVEWLLKPITLFTRLFAGASLVHWSVGMFGKDTPPWQQKPSVRENSVPVLHIMNTHRVLSRWFSMKTLARIGLHPQVEQHSAGLNWEGGSGTAFWAARTGLLQGRWAWLLFLYPAYRYIRGRVQDHFWRRVYVDYPAMDFASTAGLDIALPRMQEVTTRLALLEVPTRSDVVDRVRRVCNEERWPEDAVIERDDFNAWLETIVAKPGMMAIPARQAGECITCKSRRALYRQECKQCKTLRRQRPPPERLLSDTVVTYVGRVGIWSRPATVMEFEFKKGAKLTHSRTKVEITTRAEFKDWYDRQEIQKSCRGWNSGPIFMGHQPECFPRGEPTACLAFCLRLGTARKNVFTERAWQLVEAIILPYVEPLEPESLETFLAHFSGEKLLKMEEAIATDKMGDGLQYTRKGEMNVPFKGFTKAEKSYSYTFAAGQEGWLKERFDKRKPRFICAPNPVALLKLGPYTHAQTKWLARCFHKGMRLFYAGCSTPVEMDDYINLVRSEVPDGGVIVDDITAIDANHNCRSFAAHSAIREKQYPKMPRMVEALYESLAGELKIKIGSFVAEVSNVNASGVPDTSYKNSALCLVIRACAIAHAVRSLWGLSLEEQIAFVGLVLQQIWTSAAGDDGYSTVPPILMGTDMSSVEALTRYSEFWAECGFEVKVLYIQPHRWRMATYLAGRPVWNGTRYSWMPEPARRLKSAWWQIDNALPPNVWAKGIARQLQTIAGCHPVIRPIADMVYEHTKGQPGEVSTFSNPYSPWQQRQERFEVNPRCIDEFCMDYSVPASEYRRFLNLIGVVQATHVEFRGFLFERIFAEES